MKKRANLHILSLDSLSLSPSPASLFVFICCLYYLQIQAYKIFQTKTLNSSDNHLNESKRFLELGNFKSQNSKNWNYMALTQRVLEISFHPCVTSDRSLRVVPTYTSASVIGCKRNHVTYLQALTTKAGIKDISNDRSTDTFLLKESLKETNNKKPTFVHCNLTRSKKCKQFSR